MRMGGGQRMDRDNTMKLGVAMDALVTYNT